MTSDKIYQTEQEAFWAGSFGDDYILRNQSELLLASNLHFFAAALRAAGKIESCLEVGANVGMNLRALKLLRPQMDLFGIEINSKAADELCRTIKPEHVYNSSVLDFQPERQWDLTLVKGVLIHLDPSVLPKVYELLASMTKKFVLLAEYYNPVPVEVQYRGHSDRLFKRDFAQELASHTGSFRLVDYGFSYRFDPVCPQDDISWFLLERT